MKSLNKKISEHETTVQLPSTSLRMNTAHTAHRNNLQNDFFDHEDSAMLKEYCTVPSFIFRDRSVAVLEALVEYMHDVKKYSFHEIAVMINRNDRTIWTSYRRAKLKRKGIIKQIKNQDDE